MCVDVPRSPISNPSPAAVLRLLPAAARSAADWIAHRCPVRRFRLPDRSGSRVPGQRREFSRASQNPRRSACRTSSCSRKSMGSAEPCSRRASRSDGILRLAGQHGLQPERGRLTRHRLAELLAFLMRRLHRVGQRDRGGRPSGRAGRLGPAVGAVLRRDVGLRARPGRAAWCLRAPFDGGGRMCPLRTRKGAGPRERAPLRDGAAWSRRHAAGAAERARGGGSAATLVQRLLAERFLAARAISGGFFGAPDAGGVVNGRRPPAARGARSRRRLRAAAEGHRGRPGHRSSAVPLGRRGRAWRPARCTGSAARPPLPRPRRCAPARRTAAPHRPGHVRA